MTVMDDLTKEQRHRAMSHIKATDTKIEVLLRKHFGKKAFGIEKIMLYFRESLIL